MKKLIHSIYAQLQQIIHGVPRHDIIALAGDFNVMVCRESNTWRGTIGKFGWGEIDDSGEKRILATVLFYKRLDGSEHFLTTKKTKKEIDIDIS